MASPCTDFSVAKRGLWGMQASAAVAQGLGTFSSLSLGPGLSSCGTRAQLLWSVWDLPGPGMELMFPALAGGFFTTEPLGKIPKISLKCSPNFQLCFISGGLLSS